VLEGKLAEARSKKDTLKARAASAKTSKQVQEMMGSLNTSNAVVAFDKMEEKVRAVNGRCKEGGEALRVAVCVAVMHNLGQGLILSGYMAFPFSQCMQKVTTVVQAASQLAICITWCVTACVALCVTSGDGYGG
jgi:uncharacterized membrane protein